MRVILPGYCTVLDPRVGSRYSEARMAPFSVGEQVLVRQGDRGGRGAEVVASQPAEVYEVKMRDGSLLFYSGRQLKRVDDEVLPPIGSGR